MMRIALSGLLLLGAASGAWGQSLLRDGASPYDPPKRPSLKKHDHVQIQFQDHAIAPGAADPDRRARWDKELKEWVRFDGKEAPASSLTVTAEVIDIRPNGTLVLQAIKRRTVNKDEEMLRLTGEITPASVSMNKASAENLANLAISYEGPAAETAKPGFLGWIFGKIWPF
jgi:hypothetical protein